MPKSALTGFAAQLARLRTSASLEPDPETKVEAEPVVLLAPAPILPDDSDDLSDEFEELVRDSDEDDFDPDDFHDLDDDEGLDVPSPEPTLNPAAGPEDGLLLDLLEAFFALAPNPTDEQMHALATATGITPEALEEHIYRLLGNIFADESVGTHNV